jgi:hypothetical protein
VKLYDGIDGSLIGQYFAFAPDFTGGVNVAIGDVNCDGMGDVIVAAGAGGGPHVKVMSGVTANVVQQFFAYAPNFTGGVNVAAGDLDGDGSADIVTGPGEGGGPHVRAFAANTGKVIRDFFAYDPGFRGGVFVGVADLDGDHKAEIVTGAGNGGGPHLRAFSAAAVVADFFVNDPFSPTLLSEVPRESGLRIALADLDGDGTYDILTAKGPGTRPTLRGFRIKNFGEILNASAFATGFGWGVFVGGSR